VQGRLRVGPLVVDQQQVSARDRNADYPLHARGRVPFAAVSGRPAADVGLRPGETAARELRAHAARRRPGRDRDAGRRGDALVRFCGRHRVRVQRHRDNHQTRGARQGQRSKSGDPFETNGNDDFIELLSIHYRRK